MMGLYFSQQASRNSEGSRVAWGMGIHGVHTILKLSTIFSASGVWFSAF